MEHMLSIIKGLKSVEAFVESRVGSTFSEDDSITVFGLINDCISAIRRREKVLKCENCWHYDKMDEHAGYCENKADEAPMIDIVPAGFYCKNFQNGPKNSEI